VRIRAVGACRKNTSRTIGDTLIKGVGMPIGSRVGRGCRLWPRRDCAQQSRALAPEREILRSAERLPGITPAEFSQATVRRSDRKQDPQDDTQKRAYAAVVIGCGVSLLVLAALNGHRNKMVGFSVELA